MASRKEGTGSAAPSSSSTTGQVGKGKGKGGSRDSAVKQGQIDGLIKIKQKFKYIYFNCVYEICRILI
uniref:Uncharacterized protein n=1 Tax=Canis lupus familiaris TaxID=9615 RepID=A0A8C0MQZ7_CANLF